MSEFRRLDSASPDFAATFARLTACNTAQDEAIDTSVANIIDVGATEPPLPLDVEQSVLRDKISIRKAWRDMPHRQSLLPFDLILVSPERHRERLAKAAGFYDEIVNKGVVLV